MLPEVELTARIRMARKDLWPDGDGPEVITAEAVRELMESCGDKMTVLADWDLLRELEVSVTTQNPDWESWKRGERRLPGLDDEEPPRYLVEVVWGG